MVAIADVSHYVPAGGVVDMEARARGTSVYFPYRVIPMLPVALYKGLCSLDPGADRLSLLCDIKLDNAGEIIDFSFKKAVIRSHARLTYKEVAAIVSNYDKPLRNLHKVITPELDVLYSFYRSLTASKRFRYTLDLESDTKKFVLDSKKRISEIIRVPRTDAHRMIEECMILANTCAARFMNQSNVTGLYRVHSDPDVGQQQGLRDLFEQMGCPVKGKVCLENLQRHLSESRRKSEGRHLIHNVLQYLPKANYSPAVQPHFGLHLKAYTHFTSPIRRYSDLLVHRIISSLIEPSMSGTVYSLLELNEASHNCNTSQDRAKRAAWDVQSQLMSKLAEKHLGSSFQGSVSSVTKFGLFIEIESLLIEGLLHVSNLGNEFFEYQGFQLFGKESGKVFKLGDVVPVKIVKVNTVEGKIELGLT